MASEQDSCLDWLLSSPVALFISEMDLRQDSTPPFKDGQPKNSTAPPTRLRWPSETQRQRRPSNSSDISAPDMVVDAGPPSPGTSCEGDDYDYHSSGDMIWDSWHCARNAHTSHFARPTSKDQTSPKYVQSGTSTSHATLLLLKIETVLAVQDQSHHHCILRSMSRETKNFLMAI